MFEERDISIKAYNLNTVLAEKIESILVRNVANTRARDYYDVYILMTIRKNDIDLIELKEAIYKKAEERKTLEYIKNSDKYLLDIQESSDLKLMWKSYSMKFPYAEEIIYEDIVRVLKYILE